MKVAIFDVTRHINPTPHNVCLPVDPIDEMCLDASIKNLEIQQYHTEIYSDRYFTVRPGVPHQMDGYLEFAVGVLEETVGLCDHRVDRQAGAFFQL